MNVAQAIALIVSVIVIGIVMLFHYLKIKIDSYDKWYREFGQYE